MPHMPQGRGPFASTWSQSQGPRVFPPDVAFGRPLAGPIAPAGAPVQGAGGYTYMRLNNGMIAIMRGTAPNGTVTVSVAGYAAPMRAAVPGTPPWTAIDAQMRGVPTSTPSPATQNNIDQSAPNSGVFASIFAAFGQGVQPTGDPAKDKATAQQRGQAVVAQAAAQYGPQIVGAIASALGNKGQSLAALQRKLAGKITDYTKARAKNSPKATALAYEIKALQTQISQMQIDGNNTVPDYPSAPPVSTGTAWWLPAAILGGLALVGGAVLITSRSHKAAP